MRLVFCFIILFFSQSLLLPQDYSFGGYYHIGSEGALWGLTASERMITFRNTELWIVEGYGYAVDDVWNVNPEKRYVRTYDIGIQAIHLFSPFRLIYLTGSVHYGYMTYDRIIHYHLIYEAEDRWEYSAGFGFNLFDVLRASASYVWGDNKGPRFSISAAF